MRGRRKRHGRGVGVKAEFEAQVLASNLVDALEAAARLRRPPPALPRGPCCPGGRAFVDHLRAGRVQSDLMDGPPACPAAAAVWTLREWNSRAIDPPVGALLDFVMDAQAGRRQSRDLLRWLCAPKPPAPSGRPPFDVGLLMARQAIIKRVTGRGPYCEVADLGPGMIPLPSDWPRAWMDVGAALLARGLVLECADRLGPGRYLAWVADLKGDQTRLVEVEAGDDLVIRPAPVPCCIAALRSGGLGDAARHVRAHKPGCFAWMARGVAIRLITAGTFGAVTLANALTAPALPTRGGHAWILHHPPQVFANIGRVLVAAGVEPLEFAP